MRCQECQGTDLRWGEHPEGMAQGLYYLGCETCSHTVRCMVTFDDMVESIQNAAYVKALSSLQKILNDAIANLNQRRKR